MSELFATGPTDFLTAGQAATDLQREPDLKFVTGLDVSRWISDVGEVLARCVQVPGRRLIPRAVFESIRPELVAYFRRRASRKAMLQTA